tara:strand:+ start:187 stop:1479 length:1293 start_codon:yes stop_codon:yes gene_type:complete
MRIGIIGAGIVGCSTGYELGKRGYDVQIFDKNGEVGHGSTSASCAIVRRFYSQPGMIAMAQEASHIWNNWGDHVGAIDDDLARFERPGMLFIPPTIDDDVHTIIHTMRELGIDVELLTPAEMVGYFPYFAKGSQFPVRTPDDPHFFDPPSSEIAGAILEVDAGYIVSPTLATYNLRLAAQREGVQFRLNQEIIAIESAKSARFILQTQKGQTFPLDVLINIAGPHSSLINAMAGVELPLQIRALRREVHTMDNPIYQSEQPKTMPVVGDVDAGIYYRPESRGRTLIVGSTDPQCDGFEWIDDPDNFNENITDSYRERQCYRLMKRFPAMRLSPAQGIAALYDVTVKDWYPVVDKTDTAGYYVCIGTSGSSFKTSPVLGRLVTEIIEANESGKNTDLDNLHFELPITGKTIDTTFLSRARGEMSTSGTVIG